jgi:hypothetical protein
MNCQHLNFEAHVRVARLTKVEGGPARDFMAEITVKCADCSLPFHFVGLDAGMSFARPMVNGNGTELRAPIVEGAGECATAARYEFTG